MHATVANLGPNPREGMPKPVMTNFDKPTLAGANGQGAYRHKTPVKPRNSDPTGSSKPGAPPPLPKFKALDDVDELVSMTDDEFDDYFQRFNKLPDDQKTPEAQQALSDSQRQRQERSAGSSSTGKKKKSNRSKKPKSNDADGNSLDQSRRLPSGGGGRKN